MKRIKQTITVDGENAKFEGSKNDLELLLDQRKVNVVAEGRTRSEIYFRNRGEFIDDRKGIPVLYGNTHWLHEIRSAALKFGRIDHNYEKFPVDGGLGIYKEIHESGQTRWYMKLEA